MQTILLPTDLSLQSLLPVHHIAAANRQSPCSIVVVHMLYLPTSIGDLLLVGRTNHHKRIPAAFSEAIQLLANKYKEQGVDISFKIIHCSSGRYFKNYVEGNKINEVWYAENYRYKCTLPDSADINAFIPSCRVNLKKVSIQTETAFGSQNLSVLLKGNWSGNTQQINESALSYQ